LRLKREIDAKVKSTVEVSSAPMLPVISEVNESGGVLVVRPSREAVTIRYSFPTYAHL
jgi:hypothetical protein